MIPLIRSHKTIDHSSKVKQKPLLGKLNNISYLLNQKKNANKTLIKIFKIKIHFLIAKKTINLRLFQWKSKETKL